MRLLVKEVQEEEKKKEEEEEEKEGRTISSAMIHAFKSTSRC
jgi:hypothetical protein